MTPEAAQQELRRKLRNYFLAVVGLLLFSLFGAPLIGGFIAAAAHLDPNVAGRNIGMFAAASMFSTVVIAWVLVYRWWRCPACNANVYWLVSMNMSAFAGAYNRKACPSCGIQLFPDKSPRRFMVVLAIIAAVFVVLGALMAAGAASQRSRQQQNQPTPTAPAPNSPPPANPG
ncbi:MAG: hypothetical protein U0228_06375 [Myxococcaceae bacterium]